MIEDQIVEILLVEDNPDDVRLALRALQAKNISNHVQVVRDGEQALDFVYARGAFAGRNPARRPRVVLLDLKLPKIDGMEVLRTIKSDPDLKSIPVVVLTSSDEDRDIVESYRLGVNSYIRKPVDFAQFTDTMSQLGYYWLLLNQPPTT